MKIFQNIGLGLAAVVVLLALVQTVQGSSMVPFYCATASCNPNDYTSPCDQQCLDPNNVMRYMFGDGTVWGTNKICCSGRTGVWCVW